MARLPRRSRRLNSRGAASRLPQLGGRAEEYAIHDFEGFSSYLPSESEDLQFVCAVGSAVREHGTVFAAYLKHPGAPRHAHGVADPVAVGAGRVHQAAVNSFRRSDLKPASVSRS